MEAILCMLYGRSLKMSNFRFSELIYTVRRPERAMLYEQSESTLRFESPSPADHPPLTKVGILVVALGHPPQKPSSSRWGGATC